MNPPPATNDPLVRMMRDSCARFTHTAENAGVLAPILLLLAEAFALLFGKLEDIFLLWRAGELPPPPVSAPRLRPSARTQRSANPRRASTPRRQTRVTPEPHARRTHATHAPTRIAQLHPSAPPGRIDRYPKQTH